jgi:hypothetical protein
VYSLLPDRLFLPVSVGRFSWLPWPVPTHEEDEAQALKLAHRRTAVVERLCDDGFETDALRE